MTTPSAPSETALPHSWRVAPFTTALGWTVFIVSCMGFSVFLLGAVIATPSRNAWLVPAGAFLAGAIVTARVVLSPCITAWDDGLMVRNPGRTTDIPWSEIVSVRPSTDGLVIERANDAPVVGWAVQQQGFSDERHPTRAMTIAAEIMRLADVFTSSTADVEPTGSPDEAH